MLLKQVVEKAVICVACHDSNLTDGDIGGSQQFTGIFYTKLLYIFLKSDSSVFFQHEIEIIPMVMKYLLQLPRRHIPSV